MNNAILIGNLTKDPELRYSGETAICRFTLAVNERKKNPQTGAWEDGADFIPIVVFGRQAENCDKFLSKGRKVAINGKINTGSYVNQKGDKVYTTEVIAFNVEFMPAADNRQQEQPQQNRQQGYNQNYNQGQYQNQHQEQYISRQQYVQEQVPVGFTQMENEEDIPF